MPPNVYPIYLVDEAYLRPKTIAQLRDVASDYGFPQPKEGARKADIIRMILDLTREELAGPEPSENAPKAQEKPEKSDVACNNAHPAKKQGNAAVNADVPRRTVISAEETQEKKRKRVKRATKNNLPRREKEPSRDRYDYRLPTPEPNYGTPESSPSPPPPSQNPNVRTPPPGKEYAPTTSGIASEEQLGVTVEMMARIAADIAKKKKTIEGLRQKVKTMRQDVENVQKALQIQTVKRKRVEAFTRYWQDDPRYVFWKTMWSTKENGYFLYENKKYDGIATRKLITSDDEEDGERIKDTVDFNEIELEHDSDVGPLPIERPVYSDEEYEASSEEESQDESENSEEDIVVKRESTDGTSKLKDKAPANGGSKRKLGTNDSSDNVEDEEEEERYTSRRKVGGGSSRNSSGESDEDSDDGEVSDSNSLEI